MPTPSNVTSTALPSGQRTQKSGRNIYLDVAKGIATILVLLSHIRPLIYQPGTASISTLFGLTYFALELWTTLRCAVPLFFAVSLYLFFRSKMSEAAGSTGAVLKRRLKRLLPLTVIWTALQFAMVYAINGSIPIPVLEAIRRGGPGLTIDGAGAFYFLVDLILLLILSELFFWGISKVKPRIAQNACLFFVFAYFGVTALLPFFWHGTVIAHWLLWPFLPLLPISYLLARDGLGKKTQFYLYASLFLISCTIELVGWKLSLNLSPFTTSQIYYARPACIFGGSALLALLLSFSTEKNHPRTITVGAAFLGTWSLGIFAIHPFIIQLYYAFPTLSALPVIGAQWNYPFLGGTFFVLVGFTLFVLVLTSTLTLLLGKTPLKFLVK